MRDPKNNHRYVQVLAAARELFWKHGLKRVTVEEICREAGVSKMTFYKFFPNKVTLAKAVYDKEVETGYEKFIELYGSPQELVMELARFFIYGIMPREVGCKK